jgi:hypothetical protein
MTAYEGWAIVEQMGFKKRIGKISEVEMYGAKMLRIDLPVFDPAPLPFPGAIPIILDWVSEFAGGPSIYNITPVSDEVGINLAHERGDPRPVRPVDYRLEHKRDSDERIPDGTEGLADEDDEEIPY